MPTYEHACRECGHEWEEFYSIKADPPTKCPECKEEGSVERLISAGIGGIVILKGGDLKQKIYQDAMEYRKKIATDENARANFYGEENYNQQKLQKESLEKELVQIGKKASQIKSTDVKPNKKPGKVRRVDGSSTSK